MMLNRQMKQKQFLKDGFLNKKELELFKYLITVNGIGSKGGLAILTAMDVDTICYAISIKDSKILAKAPGIGAKTAEKIILELSTKISKNLAFQAIELLDTTDKDDSINEEQKNVIEALTALGYSAVDARTAVRAAFLKGYKEEESLLKEALKEIY